MPFATVPSYTPTVSAIAATLADVYDPTVFNQGVDEMAIELNAFVQSGIMVNSAQIAAMASGPGHIGDLPFFHGLTNDEPDYVTDNPATLSVAAAITSGKQVYATSHQHKSWSTMDLAQELGLKKPMTAIIPKIGKYWAVNTEKRLIHTAQGVMLDNIANNSGDMVNAIQSETIAGQDATTVIDADDVIDTIATLGDHASKINAIAMHSIVKRNLEKQQLITTLRDADNNVMFDVYLGKYRVIEDDALAPRAGNTDGLVYTTILFTAGAFAYGQGSPEVPSELERIPGSGNGGGRDIIHSRATEIVHPWGFSWDDSTIAGVSATYAELQVADGWTRVYNERKNIGICFLTSNG